MGKDAAPGEQFSPTPILQPHVLETLGFEGESQPIRWALCASGTNSQHDPRQKKAEETAPVTFIQFCIEEERLPERTRRRGFPF